MNFKLKKFFIPLRLYPFAFIFIFFLQETGYASQQKGNFVINNTDIHPYALHKPVHTSPKGDLITLEDGSVWKVRYEHNYLVQNWLGSDYIVLIPNRTWFTYYPYKLLNLITEDRVDVTMLVTPHYNGRNTHRIVAIDYLNR